MSLRTSMLFCNQQTLIIDFWSPLDYLRSVPDQDLQITDFIIQQIVTMPIYGEEALNICHPT